jgi:hypothetical protein
VVVWSEFTPGYFFGYGVVMKRFNEWLLEGRSYPCIVVDVQPEYCPMSDVCEKIISFVNKQTGPVLMFVNAEDSGLTSDTIDSIKLYWEEIVTELSGDYEDESPVNWDRFEIVDKGYGYFRSWMDSGMDSRIIIATIRELYSQRKSDSRDLVFPDDVKEMTPIQLEIQDAIEEMGDDPLIVNWISVGQLRKFNGAYIMGGGRDECLREVELLMNAFNIKYKRIDSLVYG